MLFTTILTLYFCTHTHQIHFPNTSHYLPLTTRGCVSCTHPIYMVIHHFLSLHHHTHDHTYQPIAHLLHHTRLSKAFPNHPLTCMGTMQTEPPNLPTHFSLYAFIFFPTTFSLTNSSIIPILCPYMSSYPFSLPPFSP